MTRNTRKWVHTMHSTCSDDGLWMRFTEDAHKLAVYEFAYWADMDSSAISDYGQYNVVGGYVDTVASWERDSALKSCGWEIDTNGDVWCPYNGDIIAEKGTDAFLYCIAECMWAYGAKERVSDESGNNRRQLIRNVRRDLR